MSSMADLPWKDAINQVLDSNSSAMHYTEIAEEIVALDLRTSVGATPAATVNANISNSIKHDGRNSPYVRVSPGEYILRKHADDGSVPSSSSLPGDLVDPQEAATRIIHAFGMFWRLERIPWTSYSMLLGRQQFGSTAVVFAIQVGVYLLHDGCYVVYVGRALYQLIWRRLHQHT